EAADSLLPQLHHHFTLGIHLVDHLTGSIDRPDVALRIDANRMGAAGIAACRSIDCRVAGCAGSAVARGDGAHLPFARKAVTPGAHEFAAALELEDGMSAAMEHQNVAA